MLSQDSVQTLPPLTRSHRQAWPSHQLHLWDFHRSYFSTPLVFPSASPTKFLLESLLEPKRCPHPHSHTQCEVIAWIPSINHHNTTPPSSWSTLPPFSLFIFSNSFSSFKIQLQLTSFGPFKQSYSLLPPVNTASATLEHFSHCCIFLAGRSYRVFMGHAELIVLPNSSWFLGQPIQMCPENTSREAGEFSKHFWP